VNGPLDLTQDIIDFEDGDLDEAKTLALFQKLIDTGLAWRLQGYYGRMARDLIASGLCTTAGGDKTCA